jgi:hypothetical protein
MSITPFEASAPKALYIDEDGHIRPLHPTAAGVKTPRFTTPLSDPRRITPQAVSVQDDLESAGIRVTITQHPTIAGVKVPFKFYRGEVKRVQQAVTRKPKMTLLEQKDLKTCRTHTIRKLRRVPVFAADVEAVLANAPYCVGNHVISGPRAVKVITAVKDPLTYDPKEDDHHLKTVYAIMRQPLPKS